ncbi:hypothetical protein PHMEG_0009707 [Phytophthora megakarya]|uniref:Uncharacterized protein n=1 Tax=Phytophthora megakarya TaxID=4795 RepID=A0A225WGF8_9STRA|nr:hypothetical protein PHMEG_0009707 [Phytophthora megakarya]
MTDREPEAIREIITKQAKSLKLQALKFVVEVLAYGLGDEICITSHTDERERELQVEEEIQQVQEHEMPQHTPARETTWNYANVLRVQSLKELQRCVQVLDIQNYTSMFTSSKQLSRLNWATAQIFATENFASTIVARTGTTCVNEFIGVCDAMLVFSNGQILLVSEFEADHILELLWGSGGSSACGFRFMNLAFACKAIDRAGTFTRF